MITAISNANSNKVSFSARKAPNVVKQVSGEIAGATQRLKTDLPKGLTSQSLMQKNVRSSNKPVRFDFTSEDSTEAATNPTSTICWAEALVSLATSCL